MTGFVGNAGEYLEGLSLTMTSVVDVGINQPVTRYTLHDYDGHEFTIFTTKKLFAESKIGDTFLLDGTVKGHLKVKGKRVTTIHKICVETINGYKIPEMAER